MNDFVGEIGFIRDHLPYLLANYDLHRQPLPQRFHFQRLLGRGGMGEVWMAWDQRLSRHVAIKTVRRDRFRPDSLQSLQEEARKLAGICVDRRIGRHVTQTFDLHDDGDRLFLISEMIEGGSFRSRVSRFGPLHWLTVSRYLIDAAEALAMIHEHDIIHRDIKPDNLLWSTTDDQVVLTDFGIAAHASEAGTLACTPGYVGLEILEGALGTASDVFALGVTGWYLIAGRNPFGGPTVMTSLEKVRSGISVRDKNTLSAPTSVTKVLLTAMEPQPADRPAMAEFATTLRRATAEAIATDTQQVATDCELDLSVEVIGEVNEASLEQNPECQREQIVICEAANGQAVRVRFFSQSGGFLSLIVMGTSGRVSSVSLEADGRPCFLRPGSGRELTFTVKPPPGTDGIVGLLSEEIDGVDTASVIRSLSSRDVELMSVRPVSTQSNCASATVQIIHR